MFGLPELVMSLLLTLPSGLVVMPVVAQVSPSPAVIEQECMPLPPWVTIDPSDPAKRLGQGELLEMSLNVGKEGDGSSATCQYKMKLITDPTKTWYAIGLSNSEKLKRQEAQK